MIVTTTDDDTAGFTLSESTALVSEDGTTADSFTIVLTAMPESDVVLDLSLGANPDAAIDVNRVTFGTSDWDQPQTINVTGLNDDVDDGDESTTITVSINDAASDDVFDAVSDRQVIVTTRDDDTAGLTLSETTAVVSEDGVSTVDSFTVVLDSQPLTDVVVKLIPDNQPDVAVSVSSLTFPPDNWNVAQTVNLSGLDDDQDDGDEQTTITIQVDDAASDNAFVDVDDQTINVTTRDDDTAGVTLSQNTALVSEDGTTVGDSFDVVLETQPIAGVVLELTLSDSPDAAVDRSTLSFTSQNWDTPQTVNIHGLDDDIDDGAEQTTLTISVNDPESDAAYDLLEIKS